MLSRRIVENISNMCSIHIAVNASVSGNRPSDCKERESRLEYISKVQKINQNFLMIIAPLAIDCFIQNLPSIEFKLCVRFTFSSTGFPKWPPGCDTGLMINTSTPLWWLLKNLNVEPDHTKGNWCNSSLKVQDALNCLCCVLYTDNAFKVSQEKYWQI